MPHTRHAHAAHVRMHVRMHVHWGGQFRGEAPSATDSSRSRLPEASRPLVPSAPPPRCDAARIAPRGAPAAPPEAPPAPPPAPPPPPPPPRPPPPPPKLPLTGAVLAAVLPPSARGLWGRERPSVRSSSDDSPPPPSPCSPSPAAAALAAVAETLARVCASSRGSSVDHSAARHVAATTAEPSCARQRRCGRRQRYTRSLAGIAFASPSARRSTPAETAQTVDIGMSCPSSAGRSADPSHSPTRPSASPTESTAAAGSQLREVMPQAVDE